MNAVVPPPPRKRGREAAAVLLTVGLASILACSLSALALLGLDPTLLGRTAAALLGTSVAVVGLSSVAVFYRGPVPLVHVCLGAGLAGLVLVGMSLFLALEPQWWRFAAGLSAPILVAGTLAFGAPVARDLLGQKPMRVVRPWILEALRVPRSILQAFLGADAAPQKAKARR